MRLCIVLRVGRVTLASHPTSHVAAVLAELLASARAGRLWPAW
ncbi:hypothetical protein [Plasticicumulans lactativorans]|nr:hypothetical protein [Plasticicumulans lactativorans]